MPGGGTDPAPSAGVPKQVRVHQWRDGEFRSEDTDTPVDYDALLARLLVDLQGKLAPAAHMHPYGDIPQAVLSVAVGTTVERPNGAEKVLFLAAGFPTNAVDEDITIIDPAFG